MPRRPASITQADVARTIRAAIQAGAGTVEIRPDGCMIIHLSPVDHRETLALPDEREVAPVDADEEIVL